MELVNYLNKAKKEKWAIGQFNFSTLEQLRGILSAASHLKSPVILGTSEGESAFLGIKETIALTEISKIKYKAQAFLNLDHGKDPAWIKKAVDYGYSAVHFDGSELSLEKNIKYAKKLALQIHNKNVLIEGEMDGIGSKNTTDAETAADFEKKTKIDSLAIAIGNKHGFYKNVKLDFKRLKQIKEKTNAFLVLHGGSGISKPQIKKAIKLGIVKINVNTELRIAWKQGIEKALKKGEIKPYNILPEAEKNVQKKVEEKIKLFGSVNKV